MKANNRRYGIYIEYDIEYDIIKQNERDNSYEKENISVCIDDNIEQYSWM